jgi:acetyl esterase/lipase
MKLYPFIFLFIFTATIYVNAQSNNLIIEKKVYKKVNGHELSVDIFYSENAQKKPKNPVIAFFHGGGWIFGNPSEFHGVCKRYAEKGFITFSFQYRLSINEDGSYPNPEITLIESVKDARSAIRWLRENAESLKIDPDRVVVSGQSAGGQLAWATALFDTINEQTDNQNISPMPNALVLYSSNYNTLEPWIDMIFGDKRELIWSVSPYHNLKPGLPPTLAIHGGSDCTVLYYIAQFFEEKMHGLGNPFELITMQGRDHYLGEGNEKYARYVDEGILERTDEFLRKISFMPQGR